MSHYKKYKITDLASVFEVVARYPFAAICKNGGSAPDIVSAPVVTDLERGSLEFHMAIGNEAFSNFKLGGNAVALFRGPNAHISPSFYKDRFADGNRSKTAPTWNYVEAKIKGTLSLMDNDGLHDHLQRLVGRFESSVGNGSWSFDEIEPALLKAWSQHIAGFTLSVSGAEATLKLSQEQKSVDRVGVIEGLRQRGNEFDLLLADVMRQDL